MTHGEMREDSTVKGVRKPLTFTQFVKACTKELLGVESDDERDRYVINLITYKPSVGKDMPLALKVMDMAKRNGISQSNRDEYIREHEQSYHDKQIHLFR